MHACCTCSIYPGLTSGSALRCCISNFHICYIPWSKCFISFLHCVESKWEIWIFPVWTPTHCQCALGLKFNCNEKWRKKSSTNKYCISPPTLFMPLNCGLPLPSLHAIMNCSADIPTSFKKLANNVSTFKKKKILWSMTQKKQCYHKWKQISITWKVRVLHQLNAYWLQVSLYPQVLLFAHYSWLNNY